MLYRTWDRTDAGDREAILVTADRLIANLRPPGTPWRVAEDDG